MSKVRDFAIENIYCSPSEDRQYRYTLVKISNNKYPISRFIMMYDRDKLVLPDKVGRYHVYVIGRIPPPMLNLGKVSPICVDLETGWVNVKDDMNERQFIFQMYDDNGINLPRENIFYTVTKQGHLVIAVKVDENIIDRFNMDDFKYIRVYTNHYLPRDGKNKHLLLKSKLVENKTQLIAMMREFDKLAKVKASVMYYVNGFLTRNIDLNMKGKNLVEAFYDESIKSVEVFKLDGLRTFTSLKDERLKYLIHRNRKSDYIEFSDDLEIYLINKNKGGKEHGVYYYQNRDNALRNITDKDYSLDSIFTNSQARWLSQFLAVPTKNVEIIIYTRWQNFERGLVYSAPKLHELYKLPSDIEFDVMSSSGYAINDFRADELENSPYMNLMSEVSLSTVSNERAMEALGYNGAAKYFGDTPSRYNGSHDVVPAIYKKQGLVYEYDEKGIMLEAHTTNNEFYTTSNPSAKILEYVKGKVRSNFDLHTFGEKIPVDRTREFIIIGALHEGNERMGDWKDLTNDKNLKHHSDHIEILSDRFFGYRVCYMDDICIYNVPQDISVRFHLIPLMMKEKHKGKTTTRPMDVFFDTVEVFMNGYRLVEGVDYFMDYPTISICNKKYLRYGNLTQQIHIRCTGFSLDKSTTNSREVKGYVQHGVLTRNNYYDIRDDRVFSAFIDGRIKMRDELRFAEDDNTIRTRYPLNGKPYVIADKKLSIFEIAEVPTEKYFQLDQEKNKRISALFNQVFPEPQTPAFNVKDDWHYLFSPLVSWMIRDVLSGRIPSTIYTKVYTDLDIRQLIDTQYKEIAELDPINKGLNPKLVEIHPDYGNAEIHVNIFQFRFIHNLVRMLTNGESDRVNLGTYLIVNRESDEIDPEEIFNPEPCKDCLP